MKTILLNVTPIRIPQAERKPGETAVGMPLESMAGEQDTGGQGARLRVVSIQQVPWGSSMENFQSELGKILSMPLSLNTF